jgi:hypothetical protein
MLSAVIGTHECLDAEQNKADLLPTKIPEEAKFQIESAIEQSGKAWNSWNLHAH